MEERIAAYRLRFGKVPEWAKEYLERKSLANKRERGAKGLVSLGKGKKGGEKKKDETKDAPNEAPVHLIKPGFSLVQEVDHYPGLFKNDKGEMFDLRPNTSEIIKPSL